MTLPKPMLPVMEIKLGAALLENTREAQARLIAHFNSKLVELALTDMKRRGAPEQHVEDDRGN